MIFILLAVIFFILRIIPGDPVLAILGGKAPIEVIQQKRHELGLDKPVIVQFFDYIRGVITGNLGTSTLTNRSVFEELKDRFPATLELTIFSFFDSSCDRIVLGCRKCMEKRRRIRHCGKGLLPVAVRNPCFLVWPNSAVDICFISALAPRWGGEFQLSPTSKLLRFCMCWTHFSQKIGVAYLMFFVT